MRRAEREVKLQFLESQIARFFVLRHGCIAAAPPAALPPPSPAGQAEDASSSSAHVTLSPRSAHNVAIVSLQQNQALNVPNSSLRLRPVDGLKYDAVEEALADDNTVEFFFIFSLWSQERSIKQ